MRIRLASLLLALALATIVLPSTALMATTQYSLCSAANDKFTAWLEYDSSTLLMTAVGYSNTTTRNGDVEIYQNNVLVRQAILAPGGTKFDTTGWNVHMVNNIPTKGGPAIGLPNGFTTGCGWPAP